MKVGELAKKTGISVRTLHHYDEIGLLVPSGKTEAGHRIYLEPEVKRLQQIMSLRAVGFSLERIKELLDEEKLSLQDALAIHLNHLQTEMMERQKLIDEVQSMAEKISSLSQHPSVNDLLDLIEATKMFEKYYSPEQLATLKDRADALGSDGMTKAQDDWTKLIAEVKAEMEKGTDPKSERVQSLACRWQALIDQFTGGDPAIAASLSKMYAEEGNQKASRGMMDDGVSAFIQSALSK
jgi:MerR family transcriptional regulator, thiopeptide resistance regulator